MGYATFLLQGRTDSLTSGIVERTVCSLGTKCSSPHILVMIAAEKLSVVTTESTVRIVGSAVATVGSLSTKVL